MVIDELFESLKAPSESIKAVSYGKELEVTESQVKTLVALSHLIPHKLTAAIRLIEDGECHEYYKGAIKVLVISKQIACVSLWSCTCHDFLRQMVNNHELKFKWQRLCRHLLAAYILENKFPILDYTAVGSTELSVKQLISIQLNGPDYPLKEEF